LALAKIETRRLSAICAAVEPSKRKDSVVCTGIATFNEQGELSTEVTGGKLEWRVSMNSKNKIKRLIQDYVQGNLRETAGVVYLVNRDRIFIMPRDMYKTTIKKTEFLPE
jgi:hypothetical protein